MYFVQASPRLRLDDSIVRKLLLRIRSETPYSETWFDEVQAAVYEKLQVVQFCGIFVIYLLKHKKTTVVYDSVIFYTNTLSSRLFSIYVSD